MRYITNFILLYTNGFQKYVSRFVSFVSVGTFLLTLKCSPELSHQSSQYWKLSLLSLHHRSDALTLRSNLTSKIHFLTLLSTFNLSITRSLFARNHRETVFKLWKTFFQLWSGPTCSFDLLDYSRLNRGLNVVARKPSGYAEYRADSKFKWNIVLRSLFSGIEQGGPAVEQRSLAVPSHSHCPV